MDWPARSPDINSIEYAWNHIGWALRNRQGPATTLSELEAALVEEWNMVEQDFIRGLIESMPIRMQAVISAKGGTTRY